MDETAEDRLCLAFEMFEFGLDMQRKKDLIDPEELFAVESLEDQLRNRHQA